MSTTKLNNDQLTLSVALPGAAGTYRGTRFAWGGIVDSVRFQGRHIFGPWRPGSFPLDDLESGNVRDLSGAVRIDYVHHQAQQRSTYP